MKLLTLAFALLLPSCHTFPVSAGYTTFKDGHEISIDYSSQKGLHVGVAGPGK